MTPIAARRRTAFLAVGAAVLLLAVALRIRGATGSLWLDEVWTFKLLENIGHSAFDVIFGLPHDNNHHLNTLWLLLVGPLAPEPLQRGLSILCGSAAVVAAGLFFGKERPAAALFAMAITAAAYPFVHYGSEARGYAGLMLFMLAGLVLVDRELAADAPSDTRRMRLGIVVVLGLLSHLGSLHAFLAAGLWAAAVEARRLRSAREGLRSAFAMFAPAAMMSGVLGLCLAVGIARYGLHVGGILLPGEGGLLHGYGMMMAYTFGLPTEWNPPPVALATMVSTALAVARFRDDRRFVLYGIGILLLPLIMFASAQPFNGVPRRHFVSAVFVALMAADLAGRAFERGGAARLAAAVLMIGFSGLQARQLETFFIYGRGDAKGALAVLAQSPHAVIATTFEARDGVMLRFYAARERTALNIVSDPRRACASDPLWLLTEVDVPLAERALPCGPNGPEFRPHWVDRPYGLAGEPTEIWKRVDR